MKLSPECRTCIFEWVHQRTAPHVPTWAKSSLSDKIAEAIVKGASGSSNAALLCNRAVFSAREIESGSVAYYQAFKDKSNAEAKELLPMVREYLKRGTTKREKLERALSVAAAANVAPLGAPSSAFTFSDVIDVIEGRLPPVLAGDVHDAIVTARRVLYVTDNAGEIGFDSIVLKSLKDRGIYVTLVVKEDGFFEDATMSDASYFGLEEVVDEIVASRGFFVRGELSTALSMAYDLCDLIIVKGTGSFEALRGETAERKVIFMLKVKCKPIAIDTGVEQGRVLVKVEAGKIQ